MYSWPISKETRRPNLEHNKAARLRRLILLTKLYFMGCLLFSRDPGPFRFLNDPANRFANGLSEQRRHSIADLNILVGA